MKVWMALLAATIAGKLWAVEPAGQALARISAEDLGLQKATFEQEAFGVQSFDVVGDEWRFVTDAGRFAVDPRGVVRQISAKDAPSTTRPAAVAFLVDSNSVRVESGYAATDRQIATFTSAVPIIDARIVGPDPSGRTIFVELIENHDGQFDRRVVALDTDGTPRGIARVPLETSLNTKQDLAVNRHGHLVHARVVDDHVEIVEPIFQEGIDTFVPKPSRDAGSNPIENASNTKSLGAIARADIVRSGFDFVRPQHVFSRSRLNVPSAVCSARDATGVMRYRIAPRAPDLANGSLSSVLYAFGGSASNSAFSASLGGTTRYIGDLCSSFIGQGGYATSLSCPNSGPAVGIDCSGFASIIWQSPRFGTSTILNSAGHDIGAAANAKSGDVLNLSGSHMVVVSRPISANHVWVLEATANNSFDRAVHAIRSITELAHYRAVRRTNLVGEVREAPITCTGCTGSGGFVEAPIGQPLSFTMATTGGVTSVKWFDDFSGGTPLNTRQHPDPTVASSPSLTRTYTSASLGVHFVTAQALHTDGSITNGRVQLTVRESIPVACMLLNTSLPQLAIPATGGAHSVAITTTPSGCVPALNGAPSWATVSANSSAVTVIALANTTALPRSASINVANRTLAVSQAPASSSNVLVNNVPVSNLSATTGGDLNFSLNVPTGAANLRFTINGGSGDADLYTRFGSPPTDTTWDCRPYSASNAETCTVASPAAGTYHVRLKAYQTFAGVTLQASYGAPAANTPPIANFNYTANGLSVQFIDTSTDANGHIATRLWSFGDGSTSSAMNPARIYVSSGTYTVTLTVTDNQGAFHTRTASVTVTGTTTLHHLSVTRAGSGSGTVTGPGINCGSDCTESYQPGTWVTLTALPVTGSTFTGWSGACGGTGPCAIQMWQSQQAVTAVFGATSTACSEVEPNNSSNAPNAWLIGPACTGLIGYSGDTDWFGGWIVAGTTITLRLEVPTNLDYDIELYGPDTGNMTQHFLRSSALGTGQTELISYTATASGNFAVRIVGYQNAYSPTSSYRLTRTQ